MNRASWFSHALSFFYPPHEFSGSSTHLNKEEAELQTLDSLPYLCNFDSDLCSPRSNLWFPEFSESPSSSDPSIHDQALDLVLADSDDAIEELDEYEDALLSHCHHFKQDQADDSIKQLTVNLKREMSDKKASDLYRQTELELGQTGNSTLDVLNYCGPMIEHIGPSLPISGSSELVPLFGGPVRKMSQNSAISSTAASFSDEQLVGSQGRGGFSIATSTELVQTNSKQESAIGRLSGKTYDVKSFSSEKHAHIPERPVSPSSTPILEDRIKMPDKYGKKRKKSRKVLDAKSHSKMEENLPMDDILSLKSNMSTLNDTDSSGKEGKVTNKQEIFSHPQPCDRDKEQKQRDNLEIKCNGDQAANACFMGMTSMDCLKLLELDNDADEESSSQRSMRKLFMMLG